MHPTIDQVPTEDTLVMVANEVEVEVEVMTEAAIV